MSPRRVPTDELLDTIERPAAPATLAPLPDKSDAEVEGIYASVLEAIVADRDSALRPPSVLFQDFQVRCRMAGLAKPPLDLPGFTRRLSAARAGIFDVTDPDWAEAMELANTLPDDMIGADIPLVVAAEGRHYAAALDRNAVLAVALDHPAQGRDLLGMRAVLVSLQEAVGGADGVCLRVAARGSDGAAGGAGVAVGEEDEKILVIPDKLIGTGTVP